MVRDGGGREAEHIKAVILNDTETGKGVSGLFGYGIACPVCAMVLNPQRLRCSTPTISLNCQAS
jgi:hypothetical protein